MADKIETLVATCEGGLDTTSNHLKIATDFPGRALRLVNFEPSLYGGYRRINGYVPLDEFYPEVSPSTSEGKVLGLAIFDDDVSGTSIIIAARKDIGLDTYSFYRYVFGVGWTQFTTPVRDTIDGGKTVFRIRHEIFNFGDGNKIVFVDGVNPAIVFDGLDWFELESTNTGASEASPGGNQLINAPAIVSIFKNHLFLSGDTDFKSVVSHSAPAKWFDFTAASGGGQIFGGFNVVQIKPFRDNLYVFGSQAINRIEPSTSGEGSFLIKPVTANVGCVARDSVVEIGGDLSFLSPDGIRPVAGTSNIGDVEIETVSKSIHVLISNLGKAYDLSTLSSVVIRSKSQMRYFFSNDADENSKSYGLIGALRISDDSPAWEFSELVGIRVSVCDSGYDSNSQEMILHGDFDGKVYKQEVGTSFNGGDIPAVYQSPYYDMGEPTVRKTLRKIYTYLRPEGDVDINLGVTYNWGNGDNPKPATYIVEAKYSIPLYGDGSVYGEINYGSTEEPVIMSDIQGSGLTVKFTYATVGTEPCYSIQGFAIDYTLEDRR